MKVELPSVEAQKAFYAQQREELLKINLQNEYTRLKIEKKVSELVEGDDDDAIHNLKSELKKVENEFEAAKLHIEVIDEQLKAL
jgi:hypothetical protein